MTVDKPLSITYFVNNHKRCLLSLAYVANAMMIRKLGKFELAQVISSDFSPFNEVIVLSLKNAPPQNNLESVLGNLQSRHPILRARIYWRKRKAFFELGDYSPIPLRVEKGQHPKHWREIAEEELNTGFDISTAPLVRCCFITHSEKNAFCEIILTFHHAIIDAASGTSFIDEMLRLWGRTRESQPHLPSGVTELLPPEDHFFPSKYRGFLRIFPISRFIRRQMFDELHTRYRNRGKRQAPIANTSQNNILTLQISEEITNALMQASSKRKITMLHICNAAILQAVWKYLYPNQDVFLRTVNFADLRPYLKPSVSPEYLGAYHSVLRYSVFMKSGQTFWDLAKVCQNTLQTKIKQGDKFVSALMSAQMMKMLIGFKAFRMGATAISYMGGLGVKELYSGTELIGVHTFASNFVIGPEYTAQVKLFKKKLLWDIVFLTSDMDKRQAQLIAAEISELLSMAAENSGDKNLED